MSAPLLQLNVPSGPGSIFSLELHFPTGSRKLLNTNRFNGNVETKHKEPAKRVRTPRRSSRKHAAVLGISERTVRRIIREELRFHPYKTAVAQQLTERDFNARQTACKSLLEGLPPDAFVFFSDEVHFQIFGCVNKQNMRYWSRDNPRELHKKPLHCERVTVFVLLCGHLKSRLPRRTLVPPSTKRMAVTNPRRNETSGCPFSNDTNTHLSPTT